MSGWRLPSADVNGDSVVIDCRTATQIACADNEYGHMYNYGAGTTMGGGVTPGNSSPFTDFVANSYWYRQSSGNWAWFFNATSNSVGSTLRANGNLSAWAVHAGNVGAVPIPAAAWLFGSGLIGLLGAAKRQGKA